MARIYQLDTISQENIIDTVNIPAEDVSGSDTVRITLGQLCQYFFSGASKNDGDEPFGNFNICLGDEAYAGGEQNILVIGNNSYGIFNRASAVGYNNSASGYWSSSAFGYRNQATDSQTSAFGHKNKANGYGSSAFGNDNTANGDWCSAFGQGCTAHGDGSTASGYYCGTGVCCIGGGNGNEATAMGYQSVANGFASTAFGWNAKTRWDYTVNIGGIIVVRADDGDDEGPEIAAYSGVTNVILSHDLDLTSTQSVTITLPDNCKFYVEEVGIMVTGLAVTNLTVQPTIQFGWTGTAGGILAGQLTTGMTALGKRERYTSLLSYDGQSSLTAHVTVAATADALRGRFYWKGMLIEDTPIGT